MGYRTTLTSEGNHAKKQGKIGSGVGAMCGFAEVGWPWTDYLKGGNLFALTLGKRSGYSPSGSIPDLSSKLPRWMEPVPKRARIVSIVPSRAPCS